MNQGTVGHPAVPFSKGGGILRITALMEDSPSANRSLISEHGLSLLVEADGFRLLFDCGQGHHFLDNAHRLGISMESLDAVVISHSHYDHAAGLRDFIESGFRASDLYVGKGFFDRKLAGSAPIFTDLSAGWGMEFAARSCGHLHIVEGTVELRHGILIHQGFPRIHPEETIPSRFVKETAGGIVADDFSDEIALSIDTPRGIAVVSGCAHPGIMNMVDSIQERTGRNIHAVIGGTHLSKADSARIGRTIEHLEKTGAGIIALCHCSGMAAMEGLGEAASHLSPGGTIII